MSALTKTLRRWRLGLQLLAVALLVAAQWQCAAPAREGAAESATGATGGNRANADAGDGGDRDSGTSGSGGAPGGIRCADAGSEPVVLASNVATGRMALDQENVYWTWGTIGAASGEGGGCPEAMGAVLKVPKCGGRVTTLATQQADPQGIAVTSTGIYWANGGACVEGGSIMVLRPDDGVPVPLATAQEYPLALVVGAQSVFWGNYDPDPPFGDTIRQISIAGGADQARASNTVPEDLVLDSENVYWIDGEGEGTVKKFPLSHGAPVQLATANEPWLVAVSEGVVYWVDMSGIWSVPAEGGESHLVFVPPDLNVSALAVDMTDIYWTWTDYTDTGAGTVNVISKDGGTARELASGQVLPRSIVVDENYVYWLNGGTAANNFDDGAVLRLAK